MRKIQLFFEIFFLLSRKLIVSGYPIQLRCDDAAMATAHPVGWQHNDPRADIVPTDDFEWFQCIKLGLSARHVCGMFRGFGLPNPANLSPHPTNLIVIRTKPPYHPGLPRGAWETALRCFDTANPLNLNRLEPAEGRQAVSSILTLSRANGG